MNWNHSFLRPGLLIEHESKTTKFCIPQLFNKHPTKKADPFIALTDFWNPILGDQAVLNSLQLNCDGPKSLALTGRNSGGKSTNLRAIFFSILLSLTNCVTPAAACSFIPFSNMQAYLNVTDKPEKDLALFEASATRAAQLQESAERCCKANKFSFLLTDELFNGTRADNATCLSFAYLKKLDSLRRNITIFSTHYQFLDILKESLPGSFKYCQVAVGSNGQPDFKLKDGIYQEANALEIAKKHLPSDVIEEAEECKRRYVNKDYYNAERDWLLKISPEERTSWHQSYVEFLQTFLSGYQYFITVKSPHEILRNIEKMRLLGPDQRKLLHRILIEYDNNCLEIFTNKINELLKVVEQWYGEKEKFVGDFQNMLHITTNLLPVCLAAAYLKVDVTDIEKYVDAGDLNAGPKKAMKKIVTDYPFFQEYIVKIESLVDNTSCKEILCGACRGMWEEKNDERESFVAIDRRKWEGKHVLPIILSKFLRDIRKLMIKIYHSLRFHPD